MQIQELPKQNDIVKWFNQNRYSWKLISIETNVNYFTIRRFMMGKEVRWESMDSIYTFYIKKKNYEN
jgi:hypothetical protein